MKALRWHGRGDVRLDHVPEPAAERGEVVIRVAVCGICGSDLHEYLHGLLMLQVLRAQGAHWVAVIEPREERLARPRARRRRRDRSRG